MSDEQFLVRLTIEAFFSGVGARFSLRLEEAVREQVSRASSVAYALESAGFDERAESPSQWGGDFLVATDEIEHEEVFEAEGCLRFSTDLFEKAKKRRILDRAVQREPHEVFVGASEIRERLPLPDTLTVDQVETLARTFDEAATSKCFGDPSVPRFVLPQEPSSV